MRVAITGGRGFVGRDLASLLVAQGHQVVVISRSGANKGHNKTVDAHAGAANQGLNASVDVSEGSTASTAVSNLSGDITDLPSLLRAFEGCDAVAHCAGINRELGTQTYNTVHVDGTRNVVEACLKQGVKKLAFTSFLKVRPNTGSAYHESKWQAEETIRQSSLDFTILKPGVICGRGDHMISHMAKALSISPVFGLIGSDVSLCPIVLADFTRVLSAAIFDSRLSSGTFAVLGGENLKLSEAARRVARVMRKPVLPIPMPANFLYVLARIMEKTMPEPLLSESQITMIKEGLADKLLMDADLPDDLKPSQPFSPEVIENALR